MKNSEIPEKSLIYLITEGRTTARNFHENKKRILDLINEAVSAKIDFVQIREKKLPARLVFHLAAEAAKIAEKSQTRILVNDRADIALAANAGGVHLTSRSIPAREIRRNVPARFVVGVSTHTMDEAKNARAHGANFVTYGTVFATPSKEKYGAPKGLNALREVCAELKDFPVIALGGINKSNYREVLSAGASGFAAIRFLNDAENLRVFDRR